MADDAPPAEHGGIDQAALAGTALAAVISVTGGSGAWGPFNTVTGLVLLLVLGTYYRPAPGEADAPRRVIAFGAVGALCVCVTSAWPLQHVVGHLWFGGVCVSEETPGDCEASHVTDCVLPWAWFATSVALWGIGAWSHRRRDRAPDAPPSRHVSARSPAVPASRTPRPSDTSGSRSGNP